MLDRMNENKTLAIAIETRSGSMHNHTLALSEHSCWASFFGAWAMPISGAIDELDAVFSQCDPITITLRGCPSACLLPMLWMRTIWFPSGDVKLRIEWDHVEDPSEMDGRQASGRLALLLADQISCNDTDTAWTHWGVDVQGQIGASEEAFDLLRTLLDLWDTNRLGAQWASAVQHALVTCSSHGHQRVALYGAGTHTRAVGDAILEPPVELVCIIDDDERRHGDRMWGYEIVSPERAVDLGIDAVVISANSIEDQLWERAAVFRERGIRTYRLYGTETEAVVSGITNAC